MEWSRYNYLFEAEGRYFLYNSLSNCLAELDKDGFIELQQQINSKVIEFSNQGRLAQFKQLRVLVDNDDDEINKIRYVSRLKRNNDRHLVLTINPTLSCNFSCIYCFEQEHSSVTMSDDVENKIIRFIQHHQSAKSLDITWFGGEPLLAFDRIVSLTQKMRALGLDYKAHIITNGYLLSGKIMAQFGDLAISSVQVTLDGLAPVHNKRRHLKSGGFTFNRIINNIDVFKAKYPSINVSVRVNIDNTNKDDFVGVYELFAKRNYPNFQVYPAFVQDLAGRSDSKDIMDRTQQIEFLKSLRRQCNIDIPVFFPKSKRYECSVRNSNSLVIGPSGELYKCWNDVGDESRIVGNVDGSVRNQNLLLRYLVGADPFEDPKCKSCILLPVCGGGCPYLRIQNLYEGKDTNTCPLIKDNLNDFIWLHAQYKNRKESMSPYKGF